MNYFIGRMYIKYFYNEYPAKYKDKLPLKAGIKEQIEHMIRYIELYESDEYHEKAVILHKALLKTDESGFLNGLVN